MPDLGPEEEKKQLIDALVAHFRRVINEQISNVSLQDEREVLREGLAEIMRELSSEDKQAIFTEVVRSLPDKDKKSIAAEVVRLTDEGAKAHTIQVRFSESAYQALSDFVDNTGRSLSTVLQEALSLEKFYRDQVAKGNRVLVQESTDSSSTPSARAAFWRRRSTRTTF